MWVFALVFLLAVLRPLHAQWTQENPQPTLDSFGHLLQTATLSFTPVNFARQYATSFEYSGTECTPTPCVCDVLMDAPYWLYSVAMPSVLCSSSEQVELVNYRVNSLSYNVKPTSNNGSTTSLSTSQNFRTLQAMQKQAAFLFHPSRQARQEAALEAVMMMRSASVADAIGGNKGQTMTRAERIRVGSRIMAAMSPSKRQALHQSIVRDAVALAAWQHHKELSDDSSSYKELSDGGRHLLNTAGNINADFSQCSLDAAYCQAAIDEAHAFSGQDYTTQTNTLLVGRLNGLLAEQQKAGDVYANTTQAQLLVLQDQITNAQIAINNTNLLTQALTATSNVQAAINATAISQADAASNIATSFFNQMDQLASLARTNLAAAQTLIMGNIQRNQFLNSVVTAYLNRIAINRYQLSSQVQQQQLYLSAVKNEAASVVNNINNPAGARTLNNMCFQSQAVLAARGRLMITRDPGVAPVVYTNAQKYDIIGRGSYYYALHTTLNDTRGAPTLRPSWVVERQSFLLVCDKTAFAQDTTDYSQWFSVMTWFGPNPACPLDPTGSCTCRVYVQYQQSRSAAALQVVQIGVIQNTTNPVTVDVNDPLVPVFPDANQAQLNALFNLTAPAVFQDANNGLLWLPPYSARWLYTMPDLANELQNYGGCLKPLVHLSQLPSLASPTMAYDGLGPPPPFPSVTGDFTGYVVRFIPVGSLGTNIYVAAASADGLSFNINDTTLASRPLCSADVTTAENYLNLNSATPLGAFLDFGIRSHNAWAASLVSVLQYMNGVGPSDLYMYTDHFAYQRNISGSGVNGTQGPADIGLYAACGVEGTPMLHIYDRTPVISVTFFPDIRSTQLPRNLSALGEIIWTAPQAEKVLPDSFNWFGYPQCMYGTCPVHVLAMVNHTNFITTGYYDTYTYSVPRQVSTTGKNPAALYNKVTYFRRDYHTTEASLVTAYLETFDGNNTRFGPPTLKDFFQYAKQSRFDPRAFKISLSQFIQLVDAFLYTVPNNSPDGAVVDSWVRVAIRSALSSGPDLLVSNILSKVDLQWDIPNAKVRAYPLNFLVSRILVPIPSLTPLIFPSPSTFCPTPDQVSTSRTTQANTELTFLNTGNGQVGPFSVQTTGCKTFQSLVFTLNGFGSSQVVDVPTCEGLSITVTSTFIAQPTVSVTCMTYVLRGDVINTVSVNDAITTFVLQTRDPQQQLTEQAILYTQTLTNLVTNNASALLQAAFIADRTIGSSLAFNDTFAAVTNGIAAIQADIIQVFFGDSANNATIQAAIATAIRDAQEASILTQTGRLLTARLASELLSAQSLLNVKTAILAAANVAAANITVYGIGLDPLNYMFSALPSDHDWQGDAQASSLVDANNQQCLTSPVPSAGNNGRGDDSACNFVASDFGTWFTCIRGPNFLWRMFIYATITVWGLYIILVALFMLAFTGPKTEKVKNSVVGRSFLWVKPKTFVNTFSRKGAAAASGGGGVATVATKGSGKHPRSASTAVWSGSD